MQDAPNFTNTTESNGITMEAFKNLVADYFDSYGSVPPPPIKNG